jgi:hypothetical protein
MRFIWELFLSLRQRVRSEIHWRRLIRQQRRKHPNLILIRGGRDD